MACGPLIHSLLKTAVIGELHPGHRPPDFMVATFSIGRLDAGWVTFPDLVIVRKPFARDPRDRNVFTHPWVVVEITTDVTERIDRGVKLRRYRSLESVEGVVLISHSRQHVEVHQRRGGGWRVTEATGGKVAVASLSLDVDEIYDYSRFDEFAEDALQHDPT